MANKGHDDGGQLAIFFLLILVKKTKAVMNSDIGGNCTAAASPFSFVLKTYTTLKV